MRERLSSRLRTFEALHSFPQPTDFSRYAANASEKRIVDLFGIGDHDSFAVPKNDVSRNSYHSLECSGHFAARPNQPRFGCFVPR